MDTPRTIALLAVALLTLSSVGVVQPTAAAPPPRPLCDACGESFAATAEHHGVALSITESTGTVTVHENGTAVWVVDNRVREQSAAQQLRSNESLREEIAERAMWDMELLGTNVSADGVVTLRYRDPEFAEGSVGGTLRSGTFTEAYGYRNLDGLGADRLTVVAPDGMAIGWAAPGATVDAERTQMTLTELETGFVTFVDAGDPLGPLWSLLAILTLVGPVVALNLAVAVGIPTALFGVLVGATSGALAWLDPDLDAVAEHAPPGLTVLGIVLSVGALLGARLSLLGTTNAPFLGVGVALVALGALLSRRPVRATLSYRRLLALAGLGVVIATGTTVLTLPLFQPYGLVASQRTTLWFLLPLFAFLPAGYALANGRRALAVATTGAGFAVAALQFGPLFAPVGANAMVGLLAALYAVAVALAGLPLAVVGRAFGNRTR